MKKIRTLNISDKKCVGANPFINSWLDVYITYFSCFQVSFSKVLICGKAYSFLQAGLEVRYGVILYSIVPSMLLIKLHNLGKTLLTVLRSYALASPYLILCAKLKKSAKC